MESIKEGLGIGEWEFDRIDLAVDSVHNYDDTFKINKYLISLASLYLETKNFTDTRGGIDLKKRSLKVWKRKIDIEIYDKKLESAGLHPYTRCEFRFKLLDNKRKEALFEELYGILDGLKECIDKLNISHQLTQYHNHQNPHWIEHEQARGLHLEIQDTWNRRIFLKQRTVHWNLPTKMVFPHIRLYHYLYMYLCLQRWAGEYMERKEVILNESDLKV